MEKNRDEQKKSPSGIPRFYSTKKRADSLNSKLTRKVSSMKMSQDESFNSLKNSPNPTFGGNFSLEDTFVRGEVSPTLDINMLRASGAKDELDEVHTEIHNQLRV